MGAQEIMRRAVEQLGLIDEADGSASIRTRTCCAKPPPATMNGALVQLRRTRDRGYMLRVEPAPWWRCCRPMRSICYIGQAGSVPRVIDVLQKKTRKRRLVTGRARGDSASGGPSASAARRGHSTWWFATVAAEHGPSTVSSGCDGVVLAVHTAKGQRCAIREAMTSGGYDSFDDTWYWQQVAGLRSCKHVFSAKLATDLLERTSHRPCLRGARTRSAASSDGEEAI